MIGLAELPGFKTTPDLDNKIIVFIDITTITLLFLLLLL